MSDKADPMVAMCAIATRLAQQCERAAVALERLASQLERFQPDSPAPAEDLGPDVDEAPWEVAIWHTGRGVVVETFRSPNPPRINDVFTIGGVMHVVTEVRANTPRMKARAHIRELTKSEVDEIEAQDRASEAEDHS